MKKILISFLFLFTAKLLFTQSLVVSGDSVVYGYASDFQLESHLQVVNNSNNTVLVYCEKNVILQNQTGINNFCWGGTCYGAGTIVSTKLDTILAGDKSTGFGGYYQPWNVPSTAKVEYCFYLSSNSNDRSCFTVTYDATSVTGIESLSDLEELGSFYPNPSDKYTNFSYNVKGISVLHITDILGNVVKSIEIEGSGKKTIYVGDLHKGIYFGNLIHKGETVKIKKLIINK